MTGRIARHSWDEYKIQRLIKLVEEGVSTQDIADYFGVVRSRIYQVLHKFAINPPERSYPHKQNTLSLEEYVIYRLVTSLRRKASYSDLIEVVDLKPFPIYCPVLDIKLDYAGLKCMTNGYRSDASPSLDRINNKRGYIPGNVKIISWRANRIKNDGDAEEHLKIAKYIEDYS